MRRSQINVLSIQNNSNRVLTNVLQATIVNNGGTEVTVFGIDLTPLNSAFRIDPTNTVFDLDLEEIDFLNSDPKNKVTIAYQTLLKDHC